MISTSEIDNPPDIKLGGLSLWVEGRERPEDEDYWDGNWLLIRAKVEAHNSYVGVSGPWLRTDEIASFLKELDSMSNTLKGKAELAPIEPYLKATLEMNATGQITARVDATPDHLSQRHTFHFELDQSFLPEIIRGCRNILLRFPIKRSQA